MMTSHRRIIFGTTPLYIALCACMFGLNVLHVAPSRADNQVVINEQALSPGEVSAIERLVRGRLLPGRYWYDRIAGLWGYERGPTVGFALAGLSVGGALKSNASRGNTGVFINGRELHLQEVAYLQTLGPVWPGRYTLNALGYVSVEGQSIPFAHLPTLHARRWSPTPEKTPGGAVISSSGNCINISGKSSSGIGNFGAFTCR